MSKKDDLQPSRFPKPRNPFVIVLLALLMAAGGYELWKYPRPPIPFSQIQYDNGYLLAFRLNATAPGYVDYKAKFWSAGKGFGDGWRDFDKIYQHPRVGPFSYDRLERRREVLAHVEESASLDPNWKTIIVKALKEDLNNAEKAAAKRKSGDVR